MNFWKKFENKYPKAAKWIREGGLFVIVSNLITVFKYLLLTFLPAAFALWSIGTVSTMYGESFSAAVR